MTAQQWDAAARRIAKIVVEQMPYLNENKIASRLYGYFSGENYASRSFDDNRYYFVEDLKEILENAFTGVLPEDDDRMAAASDVQWAFDQLPVIYQYRIEERYRWGVIRLADSTERAQLNAAIRKMCDILNGWNRRTGHEGPGSRKAWSNARAATQIRQDYSGGSGRDDHQWIY